MKHSVARLQQHKISRAPAFVGAMAIFSLALAGCESTTAVTIKSANMPGVTTAATISVPAIVGISPGYKANNNNPKIYGVAPTDSTVNVYTNNTCTSAVAGTGTAATFQSPGITLPVADDTINTFYIQSVGTTTSACIGSVTYTEDSTAPLAAATFVLTNPLNTTTSGIQTPTLSGTGAENGTTVYLYSDNTCTTLLKTAGVSGGSFTLSGFILAGSGLKSFYYKIADTSGNFSACFDPVQSYTLDATPPAAPTLFTLVAPVTSPSNSNTPSITGTAVENTAIVKVYSDAGCSIFLNQGTVIAGAFTIGAITLPAVNGTKTFYYTIQDTYGNVTACATTGLTYVMDVTAPTITDVTTTTASGTYNGGTVIPIQVTFSEVVNVDTSGGTPTLQLATAGTVNELVSYVSGTGTNVLTFTYLVQPWWIFTNVDISANLNYVATNSLALNGGTIKDAAGNNATLTLPAVTAPHSLGANKNIVLFTTATMTFLAGGAYPANPYSYGTQSANVGPQTYTLQNSGGGQQTSAITISMIGGSASAYSIVGGTCLGAPASTVGLAVGATCTVQVNFLAGTQAEGTFNAAIMATATTGGVATHNVTGIVQCPTATQVFSSNGSYTVPGGCTDIEVKAWGGAGGSDCCFASGARGGGGGYATSTKHLSPGDSISIAVGGAGGYGGWGAGGNSAGPGGTNGGAAGGGSYAWDGAAGGGGFSGYWQTATSGTTPTCGPDFQHPCMIAGGGGGSASDDVINNSGTTSENFNFGGPGGGLSGLVGGFVNDPQHGHPGQGGATVGYGGTVGAGGTAGAVSGNFGGLCDQPGATGAAGSSLPAGFGGNGGTGAAAAFSGGQYGGNGSGGGGGGGFMGGGGGGSGNLACTNINFGLMGSNIAGGGPAACPGAGGWYCTFLGGRTGGGGGGGSSYAPSATGVGGYLKASTTAAIGAAAGNPTDSDLTTYCPTCAIAGVGGSSVSGAGLVVIHPHGSSEGVSYP